MNPLPIKLQSVYFAHNVPVKIRGIPQSFLEVNTLQSVTDITYDPTAGIVWVKTSAGEFGVPFSNVVRFELAPEDRIKVEPLSVTGITAPEPEAPKAACVNKKTKKGA